MSPPIGIAQKYKCAAYIASWQSCALARQRSTSPHPHPSGMLGVVAVSAHPNPRDALSGVILRLYDAGLGVGKSGRELSRPAIASITAPVLASTALIQ